MEKPAVGNNASQIMEMLGQADSFLKQVETLMQRMDRMGLKPLIVRGVGAKLGVDAESPLKSEKPEEFKSSTHKKIIEGLNLLSEDELNKQMEALQNVPETKKSKNS
jgi:hypothetical protein